MTSTDGQPDDAAAIAQASGGRDPPAIQPHGCTLICALPTWTVTAASANCADFLGREAAAVLDLPLDGVLPHKAVHDLRNVLQSSMVSGSVERLLNAALDDSAARYDLMLHAAGPQAVIEILRRADGAPAGDPGVLVKSMIGRLRRAQNVARLLGLAASQVRAVTGFDRVLIYKFLPDDTGLVVAEALRGGLAACLNLRYPAADIPPRARALYRRQWLRLIPDVEAEPVSLVFGAGGALKPDLSLAVLRSVSSERAEALRRMGARATLTFSLMEGDRLWGLIACHHAAPRLVSSAICATVELFGQILAMQIGVKDQAEQLLEASRARDIHTRWLDGMASEPTIFDDLLAYEASLRDCLPCDGAVLWLDQRPVASFGTVPSETHLRALVSRLDARSETTVFASDAIDDPGHGDPAVGALCGVLAIPVQRRRRDYLILFRRETVQTILWGGDPDHSGRRAAEPRAETVRGRSLPWSASELQVADAVRVCMIEAMLRRLAG